MGIPDEDRDNLIAFRDKYCISDLNATEIADETLLSRILVNWDENGVGETDNSEVILRTLMIKVFVRKTDQYNAGSNALDRRQDMIVKEITKLLHNNLISGFKFKAFNQADLYSNSIGYVKCFVSFRVKHIF